MIAYSCLWIFILAADSRTQIVNDFVSLDITPMFRYLFILFLMIAFSATAQDRVYHTGPNGGCYYINKNGNKTYVDRSLCGRASQGTPAKVVEIKTDSTNTSSGSRLNAVQSTSEKRVYYKGPRGGCYYISKTGSKVYVDRSVCE